MQIRRGYKKINLSPVDHGEVSEAVHLCIH